MLLEYTPGNAYELGAKYQREDRQCQEAHEAASRKCVNFISEIAAASANSLNGVGGGSIAGNIRLQKGCFWKAW